MRRRLPQESQEGDERSFSGEKDLLHPRENFLSPPRKNCYTGEKTAAFTEARLSTCYEVAFCLQKTPPLRGQKTRPNYAISILHHTPNRNIQIPLERLHMYTIAPKKIDTSIAPLFFVLLLLDLLFRLMKLYRLYFPLLILTLLPLTLQGQKRVATYEAYVHSFAEEAVLQMNRHQIPASITLAQGLVETGGGQSFLAREANNHFGIKCHNSWQGKKVYRADDGPNDCFRTYKSARESYEDHSLFLKKPRYADLFKLNKHDYIGWARGLQKAGYATNRGYANMLIKVIEDYELYAFDRGKTPSWFRGSMKESPTDRKDKQKEQGAYQGARHTPYMSYGLLYVIAAEDDTFGSIASEFGLRESNIAKWNDAPVDFPLNKGDLVWLGKKNSKATLPYYDHVVKIGESMHSISQRYGLRMKNLYKMNKKSGDYVPEEGDVLRLR